MILERLNELIKTLNNTQGTINKGSVMKEYEDLKPIILKIYDTNTKSGITPEGYAKYVNKIQNIDLDKKYKNNKSKLNLDIYNNSALSILDALVTREITGDIAKEVIRLFIEKNPKYSDLIVKIMSKDLKILLNAKQINNIFGANNIKIFSILLSKEYSKKILDRQLKATKVIPKAYISRKIDGVRLIANRTNGKWKFFSRSGKLFTTLDNLGKYLCDTLSDVDGDIWLDGEAVAIKNGKENFKETIVKMRPKNADGSKTINHGELTYNVFDILTKDDWDMTSKALIYSYRLDKLNNLNFDNYSWVKIEPQYIYSESKFEELKKEMAERNEEGVMIRINHVWENKRSNNLLKFKFFNTEEFKVIDVVLKDMDFRNKTGGVDIKKALNAVIIEFNYNNVKNKVSVGSGFDQAERLDFGNNPNSILGKTISVRYQDISQDKDGKYSLRLPTYQGLYGRKRDI